jgi:acrylyl-CoA reductase (NADPH)
MTTFKALQSTRHSDKSVSHEIIELEDSLLPEGDVTVDVAWSTLNYKDGLVLNGLGGLVREWPHVSGIDFAGTVSASTHPNFSVGDEVIHTGWRVGEIRWGGHAQRARVKGDWLVPLPEGMDMRNAMAIGTAGLTAMLGLMALEESGLTKDSGPVLVTGAAGGVGSVASALLAANGYEVEGSTGRADTHDYLRGLGVSRIIDRTDIDTPTGKPLESEHWAACIDAVGGSTLANVLSRLRYNGAVAAIGLAGGASLDTTVIPFLLRGVKLLGIDSVMCPIDKRVTAWQRLASELPAAILSDAIVDASLTDLPELGKAILAGQVRGRVVVNPN